MNNITTDMKKGIERHQQVQQASGTESLPVYRAASNVLCSLMKIVSVAPRKMMRFCDKATADAAELLKCIALANLLCGDDRVYYLQVAEANAIAIKSYTRVFVGLGAMSRADGDTLKKQLKSVTAQIAGWRASTMRQCHVEESA